MLRDELALTSTRDDDVASTDIDPALQVEPEIADSPRLLRGVPTAIAIATVVLGVVDVIDSLAPERAARLHDLTKVVPLGVAQGANGATVVAGLLLIMLGQSLRRRKRRAWRAALALSVLTMGLHVVRDLDVEAASITLVLTILLIALSCQFYAEGDPRTRLRAPVTFAAMLIASFGLGYLLLVLRGASLVGSPSVAARFTQIAYGLIGVAGPIRFKTDGTSDFVFAVLVALGTATVLTSAYLALRPAEPVSSLSSADEERLRVLLAKQGQRDSLGYFALRRDKSAVFSPTCKAAVSYRVVSGVMLASGDPLGDPEAWPGAIAEFLALARRHAWVPAVMGCSEQGGEVWVREAELRALELGDEAVIDIADFTLEGRAMRNVRQMVSRVERAGYTTEVYRVGDMSTAQIDDIRRQAAAWRGAEVERGFSMALGRFGDPRDGDCVAVIALRNSRLAAVLHFVPWGPDGLSLELMRRDRDADPGLNELMIVAAIQASPELGVTRLSLNFSAFRSALERGARLGAGPVLRSWRALLLGVSRWFQIESLYRFNAKFRPVWEPRFICYPGAGDIPRIALAALEAEAFIVWPKQWLAIRKARRLKPS
jgi:lysyl-tRNA synthetase class 2